MKKGLLALLLCLLPMIGFADIVPVSTAEETATQFFTDRKARYASTSQLPLTLVWDGTSALTRSGSQEPPFYVFNRGNNQGFVIVSGDDAAIPILAYSYEGSFEAADMPENLSSWMTSLANEIGMIRAMNIQQSDEINRMWSRVTAPQKAFQLNTLNWEQRYPFNYKCPDGCPTGCAITATGIAMAYHKWPDCGVGSVEGYTQDNGIVVSGVTLGEKYLWDEMPGMPGHTQAGDMSVASLMQHVGVMGQAYYSPDATASRLVDVSKNLTKHMKYHEGLKCLMKASYSDKKWHEMLHKELHEHGPVVYAGSGDEVGGHAFVIDGYDERNYYSVNWGWGGMSNGFYSLNALNTDMSGQAVSFTDNQYGFFDLIPVRTGDPEIPDHEEFQFIKYGKNSKIGLELYFDGAGPHIIEKGTSLTVFTQEAVSHCNHTVSGEFSFVHTDRHGNIKEHLLSINFTDINPGLRFNLIERGTTRDYVSFMLNQDVMPGDRLMMMFKTTRNGKWTKIICDPLMGKDEIILKEYDGSDSEPINVTTVEGAEGHALAAFSAPFNVTPSDPSVEAYYAEVENNAVVLRKIEPANGTLVIPANIGVILSTGTAANFTMNFSKEEAAGIPMDNILCGSGENGTTVETNVNAYKMTVNGGTLEFRTLGNSRNIAANSAYLIAPEDVTYASLPIVFGAKKTYHVSTEVQKKNVLLEEFSGANCPNCPLGHELLEEMKDIMGNRLNAVAIQYGSKAYDGLMVDAGTFIGNLLMPSSWPNGSINRHNWNGDSQYAFGRGMWVSRSREALNQDAPVNLWAEATYNSATRKLDIHVEGFFTGDVQPTQRLSLLLVQNNVQSYQNTKGGYDYSYMHHHLLRDAINGDPGEELTNCSAGSYFSKDYSYDVPASIKNIDVVPADIEVLAFVTGQDGKEVHNSITIKPEYPGQMLPLKADIKQGTNEIGDGYQFRFVKFMMSNGSNSAITSADFDVTLNGATVQKHWTGDIKAFGTQEITLPVDWSAANQYGQNNYMITLSKLNGQGVSQSSFSGSFNGQVVNTDANVKVKVFTAPELPENYTYRIYDMDGTIVKEFGPYTTESTAYEENVKLYGETMYCMEVYSKWKDGYTPDYVMQLCNEDGSVAASIKEITKCFSRRVFFKTGAGAAAQKATLNVTSGKGGQVSVKGQTVREATKGIECKINENVQITIMPDQGYKVKTVTVDGTDMTSSVTEGKISVKMNKTKSVNVTFEQKSAAGTVLTIIAGNGGEVAAKGQTVRGTTQAINCNSGEQVVISITPDHGYSIQSVMVGDIDYTTNVTDGKITITMNADTKVRVNFAQQSSEPTLRMIISKGGSASIFLTTFTEGTTDTPGFDNGSELPVTVTADEGYQIKSITVAGKSIEASGTTANFNVTINGLTIVKITFEEKNAKPGLRINVGEGGSVICYGTEITSKADILTSKDEMVKVTIRPDRGYKLSSVLFNGQEVINDVDVTNGVYVTPVITSKCTLDVIFSSTSEITGTGNGNIKIYAHNGVITIEGLTPDMLINIFTAHGAKVNQVKGASSAVNINLTPGQTYIINIYGRSYKIAL